MSVSSDAIINYILAKNESFATPFSPHPPLDEDAGPLQPPGTRHHFPDIMVDAAGTIALCPGCSGSAASKDGDFFICRSCGSVWRGI